LYQIDVTTDLEGLSMGAPRRGLRFSIRALMAMVAVIALGLGVLGVAGEAHEVALRRGCEQKLKMLGIACHNYCLTYDALPPGTVAGLPLPVDRRLSPFVVMYGFREQQGEVLLIDFKSAWDEGENREPKLEMHSVDAEDPVSGPFLVGQPHWLTCPCNPARAKAGGPGLSHYVGIGGLGVDAPSLPVTDRRAGVFGYDRATRLEDIKDGTAATMMFAETALANGPWTAGGPATVRGLDPARQPYIGPGRQFGGTHRGGAMVLFVDGSVRFVAASTDPRILEAASTIAGGEDVGGAPGQGSP
jgi:prepilin-type processing-associated H-X9-DG protein